jgi:hypothetical protein
MLGKNNEIINEIARNANVDVKVEVSVISPWDKLKKKNKEINYYTIDANSEDPIHIGYCILSKAQLDALSEKYESMKKPRPKEFVKGINKWMEVSEDDKKYIEWQKETQAIDNLRWAETTIMALINKPEGNNLEEQVKFLKEVMGGGHYDKLALEIMKSSGYDIGKEIENAKNA